MRILEIKSIDYGSTNYVSDSLKKEFKKEVDVDSIDNTRNIIKQPLQWFKFYKKCQEFDILHTHLGSASRFTSFLKKNKIQVSTLHGFQKIKHYKKSNYFTAVSNAVKQYFIDQGIPEYRIKVIPNGVKDSFLNMPLKINNSEEIIISQIGHLTKNVDFTFDVIRKLVNKNLKFKFLFVGGEGDLDDLRQKAKVLGILDYVEFLGFIENIEKVYEKTDILFSSSEREGFCLPILEAMASGTPVVSFDNGGINDYFIHEVNGYIYNTLENSVAYLALLIQNKELRNTIGIQNKNDARKFTWDKVANFYLEYFKEILSTKLK